MITDMCLNSDPIPPFNGSKLPGTLLFPFSDGLGSGATPLIICDS